MPSRRLALEEEEEIGTILCTEHWCCRSSLLGQVGGQVGNVAFPGKIMADSETQKLERKDFFQRIVEKVDGGFF